MVSVVRTSASSGRPCTDVASRIDAKRLAIASAARAEAARSCRAWAAAASAALGEAGWCWFGPCLLLRSRLELDWERCWRKGRETAEGSPNTTEAGGDVPNAAEL